MVNKQNVKMMTVAAIIGVSAIGATTAFAAGSSSTQPRYTLQETPSYPSGSCAFTDRECAAADGKNSPVSRGDNVCRSYATARNNTEEPQPQGSTPELATSASTIKYKVRYRGTQDAAAGHLAYYQYGTDLMRESGSGWIKHGGCYPAVHGDGTNQGTATKTCSGINSGTNTCRMRAQRRTAAAAYLFGNDGVPDHHSDSSHATTPKLGMCANR